MYAAGDVDLVRDAKLLGPTPQRFGDIAEGSDGHRRPDDEDRGVANGSRGVHKIVDPFERVQAPEGKHQRAPRAACAELLWRPLVRAGELAGVGVGSVGELACVAPLEREAAAFEGEVSQLVAADPALSEYVRELKKTRCALVPIAFFR